MLHVSKHPLVGDCMAGLRDKRTPPDEFRSLSRKVISLLLYEATADLPVHQDRVETPLGPAEVEIVEKEVVAVPVLRAGLGLLGPVLELLPKVSVGYIGLERDEETAVARIYYNKLPPLKGKVPLLLDPMLEDCRFVCVVAAPEGVRVVEERHPEVKIFAAALDQGLNDRAYIVPGLGDFGDRLFGTLG